MAGFVGVARAGIAVGPSAKRRKLGPAVPPAESTSSPSLANLARLASRLGELIRPPPPRDPMTQPELWEGGGEDAGDPMFLEFLRACMPHLGWMSTELRCTPWILVKRLTLFIDRVFDTAEDYRLPTAVSVFVKALGRVKLEDWRGLLHVTTSPTPRG